MLNKKQLKARGWTDSLIRKFYPNKNCRYSLRKVENIEECVFFQYEMIKTNTRRERAKNSLMLSRECMNLMRKNNPGMFQKVV